MATSFLRGNRAVRILAAALISITVLFVAIGFVKPVVTVETVSRVDRSPFVAFHVMTDASRIGEWMDDFVSIETVLDRDEPVGNTSVLRMTSGTDTLEMRQEITVFEPAERFAIAFDSPMTTGSMDIQLLPVEDGTQIVTTSRFEGTSWFWRSLFPLMAGEIRSTQQGDYDRLAALIATAPVHLEGDWAGVDAEGNEQLFHFAGNGRLDWKAASGGEWFELDGLQYALGRESSPMHLDIFGFSQPPLEGMVLYGIVDIVSDDSLRLDLEAAPPGNESARPDSFTSSTVDLRRVR